jgi:hypothetical protein
MPVEKRKGLAVGGEEEEGLGRRQRRRIGRGLDLGRTGLRAPTERKRREGAPPSSCCRPLSMARPNNTLASTPVAASF